MSRAIVLGVLLGVVGCAVPRSVTFQKAVSGKIAPDDRSRVWARALHEFQARGLLVSVSDRAGGVLASQGQPSTVACGGGYACTSYSLVQLTIDDAGEATLRVNRTVSGVTVGGEDLLDAAEERAFEAESTDLLSGILGRAIAADEAAASRTQQKPASRGGSVGMACASDSDCQPGLSCTLAVCRR